MDPPIPQLFAQAAAHHQAGRIAEAQRLYRQILRRDPNHADALHLLSLLAHSTGHTRAAIELIERAIGVSPRVAEFYVNYGLFLAGENRLEEAASAYTQSLSVKELPDAHYNLANALRRQARIDQSIAHYRRALALRPDAAILNNLADVLCEEGQIDEAVLLLERAIQVKPDYLDAHNNLGTALQRLGKVEGAISCFERALQIQPESPEVQRNLAMALLLTGDYEHGLALYEQRRRIAKTSVKRDFRQPLWDGSDLRGQTILLHDEQGLGDTLQFVRFVPMVQARGGRVILECQPPLQRLLQSQQLGIEQVIADGQRRPHFDLQCPLISLAYLLQTTLDTIPANIPYLHADAALAQYWHRELVAHRDRKKIGLGWAGSPVHRNDRDRSFTLDVLVPLAKLPDVQFFSLQKGEPARQAAGGGGDLELIDRTHELADFADTAALVANLDAVVSADTSVAHLAGAMGKPTALLLPFAPDWRWLIDRDDSPWYPTMRLFRQPKRGDWHSSVQSLVNQLQSSLVP